MITNIEISTVVGCTNDCSYCPQSKINNSYQGKKQMSYQDFIKYTKDIPKNVSFEFCGFAEPFQNNDAINMIDYASLKKHDIKLFTTLVGLKLEQVIKLSLINFKLVKVHLPSALLSEKFTANKEYLKTLECVLNCEINNLSFVSYGEPDSEVKSLVEKYGKEISKIQVISRAGNLCKNLHKKGEIITNCGFEKTGALMPNGEVFLCGNDYGLKHKLGDLSQEPFSKNFGVKKFKELKQLMKTNDSDIICRDCEYSHEATLFRKFKRLLEVVE